MVIWCADDKWNEVKQFLASADSDGNGVLSKEEFKNGLVKLGISDADATLVTNQVLLVSSSFSSMFCG